MVTLSEHLRLDLSEQGIGRLGAVPGAGGRPTSTRAAAPAPAHLRGAESFPRARGGAGEARRRAGVARSARCRADGGRGGARGTGSTCFRTRSSSAGCTSGTRRSRRRWGRAHPRRGKAAMHVRRWLMVGAAGGRAASTRKSEEADAAGAARPQREPGNLPERPSAAVAADGRPRNLRPVRGRPELDAHSEVVVASMELARDRLAPRVDARSPCPRRASETGRSATRAGRWARPRPAHRLPGEVGSSRASISCEGGAVGARAGAAKVPSRARARRPMPTPANGAHDPSSPRQLDIAVEHVARDPRCCRPAAGWPRSARSRYRHPNGWSCGRTPPRRGGTRADSRSPPGRPQSNSIAFSTWSVGAGRRRVADRLLGLVEIGAGDGTGDVEAALRGSRARSGEHGGPPVRPV